MNRLEACLGSLVAIADALERQGDARMELFVDYSADVVLPLSVWRALKETDVPPLAEASVVSVADEAPAGFAPSPSMQFDAYQAILRQPVASEGRGAL